MIGKGKEPGNGVSYMFLEEGSEVSDGKCWRRGHDLFWKQERQAVKEN